MNNKERAEQIVDEITNFVNTMSLDPSEFIAAMAKEHRTLQQSFTKLCIQWLEYVASDDYRHDPRNEASHEIAKKMIEGFYKINHYRMTPSAHLPMI